MKTHDTPNSGNIRRSVLANGAVLLTYEMPHVKSVVIHGELRAGSLYNTTAKLGVASLTATTLTYGTQKRDFDAIHATLEDIGADFGYGAGVHHVGFGGKALADDLPAVLDVMRETLEFPTFPDDLVNNIIRKRLTELEYAQQDTRYQARRAFLEALYPPEHPYHHNNYGTLDSLPLITPDNLRQFHAQTYGSDGMLMVVVGAITHERALQQVQDALADWQNPQQPAPKHITPIAPPSESKRVFTPIEGKTQSDLVIGTLSPTRQDPYYIAASLANSILGEFGMMGRIGASIREELGLAYYAYSQLEGGEAQGAWSVTAGVSPKNLSLAIEKATDELRRMGNELVSENDLADNQSYFTGRLPLRLESPSGVANTIEMMEHYQLGLDYLANYHDMIYSITREDIQKAVHHYINPETLVISVAGTEGD